MTDHNKIGESRNLLVAVLLLSLSVVIVVGSMLALTIFITTGLQVEAFDAGLCFTNQCFERFVDNFSATFLVLKVTGTVLAGVITLGGILIALLSYLNSLKTTALSNHLSHLSMFHTYVTAEIDKRPRLERGCFDLLCWYNLIYSKSKIGLLEISNGYIEFIEEINSNIAFSNALVRNEEDGGYRYKNHQAKMKETLSRSGITMHSLPRLDFHEAEGEVFDLIQTVNCSFCHPSSLVISSRDYL